ncbi:SGNH/GDSL hydrolase family protein [Pseudomonas viridiflava]|uniref:SGNH/GDSL hydrolase family protein n=1 Tax=Pseudomonas viridiflava TaxID=33069 RepID=UPI0013CEA410|nr:SGNH/GDSL hydrolase family protein [Pseudomonas viridiflava]
MLPFIYDDNVSTMRDEGVDTSRWTLSTPTAGNIMVVGSSLKISTAGVGVNYSQPVNMPPENDDFIIYVKLKAEYAQGKASVVHFNGLDGKPRIGFALGYSYVSQTLSLGQLSVINKDGSAKSDYASINYSESWCDLAIHGCRSLGTYRVYLRDANSEWLSVFSGDISQIADISSVVVGSQFSLSQPSHLYLDHILICRPNIVSIGDSICAGYAVPADPYVGWQKYAKLYSWLRNDLIVNLGVPGNSSQQISDRIVSSSFAGARLVFLHASSNDFRLGVSASDRTQITQRSITAINAFGAKCVLINGIYPNSRYVNADYQAETAYQKQWWESSAITLTGLSGMIDIMLCLKGVMGAYIAEALARLEDGKHPNMPGTVLMGRLIKSLGTISTG